MPVISLVAWRTSLRPGQVTGRSRWIEIGADGVLRLNADRHGNVGEWTYVLVHGLLHLGHGHHLMAPDADPLTWNLAADLQIQGLLKQLTGDQGYYLPDAYRLPEDLPKRMSVFEHGRLTDHPALVRYAEQGGGDLIPGAQVTRSGVKAWTIRDWQRLLAQGLREHAADAIDMVAAQGWREDAPKSAARLVLAWFMANFPLLSALAAGFTLIEDQVECRRLDIEVAAVNAAARIIYINPRAGLTEDELRFVIAHEVLHVALMHQERLEGRDPYLWNLAADAKINQWLIEMRVGAMPSFGGVLLPEFDALAAEEIYAKLAADLRRARKLLTLRGSLGDMLGLGTDTGRDPSEMARREDWVRGALLRGLELHHQRGRGDLPADLIEQVELIAADPVPWDAQLAEWFQRMFPPVEPQRSYARASRRQSSTPDIARPGRADRRSEAPSRVFSVLLDTSASMGPGDLGQAMGAIVAYSLAHEVDAVRLIDCDAQPYDRGWVAVESLAGRVEVHGRGGTRLQPALDLLETIKDLPPAAPVMIITDGAYEQQLQTRRDHCYVMAPGTYPAFPTRGPVFSME
jgi:predicted metal-dependent peptidase